MNAQKKKLTLSLIIILSGFVSGNGQKRAIDTAMYHLRNSETREWSEFPAKAEKKELVVHFVSGKNDSNQTLSIRQYDVKQNWKVVINEHNIGSLVPDEKDMRIYLDVPPGILRDGENTLRIQCSDADSDDIRVGMITMDSRIVKEVLSEATVEITVIDAESQKLLPSRITILDSNGVLQTVAALSTDELAIRPGCVYTGTGKASLLFPAGRYTIYAGRGFEYGIDSIQVTLKPHDHLQKKMFIQREVNTIGWISSDTHVHTFTYSRHGDATEEERALTIAGEGIELPILTDHNIYTDLTTAAQRMHVLPYLTPVTGDELTTKVGHFNVFPVAIDAAIMDHQSRNWAEVSSAIGYTVNKVVILNHARDIHNTFRPFDPSLHVSHAGVRVDDWRVPANAMEVINSGSQQNNIMSLFEDWFGLLNHGYTITPVGSSDSHDVSRYTVGQGRTYIQSRDDDPGHLNKDEAIRNLISGRVMVSLGLLTKMVVNNSFGPGDIVPASDHIKVSIEVCGPSWIRAERVSLYANGIKIREEKINERQGGIKWSDTWQLSKPKHDVFLVAIAEGPGNGMPYWPIAKPYQPTSPDWHPRVMGSTGTVWIDADKDGKRTSAYAYALHIINTSDGNMDNIIKQLANYDETVVIQVAATLWKNGKVLNDPAISKALQKATPSTKSGFEVVIKETAFLKKE